MAKEFRKLVGAPLRPLHARRREILRYIAAHPGITPYRIATDLFQKGVSYSSVVFRHLEALKRVGAVSIVKKGRRYQVFLTEEGKTWCINEGIITPEDQKTGAFLHDLNKALDPPLSLEESKELRSVLSARVLEALEEIAGEYYSMTKDPDLSPPSLLEAVWIYEVEKTVLLPKVERWKDSLSSYIEEILSPFFNLPPPLAPELREEVMKVMERMGVGNVLKETLFVIRIARNRRVEAELDRLLSILGRIVKKERALDAYVSREGLKREVRVRYFYIIQARLLEKFRNTPPEVCRSVGKILLRGLKGRRP